MEMIEMYTVLFYTTLFTLHSSVWNEFQCTDSIDVTQSLTIMIYL